MSREELSEDLSTNDFPAVVISNGGPDYADICEKYNACYIHSDIDIEKYSVHECLEVILNRICLSAAALPVSHIHYFVNDNLTPYYLSKDHILNKIATNKLNIIAKHKKNTTLSYTELFADLEKW